MNTLSERLAAWDARATAGNWMPYSEPEVGMPCGLFAGSPMVSGFMPIEPLSPDDIEFISQLVNAYRAGRLIVKDEAHD